MHNETFKTTKDINDIKIALLSDIHYSKNFNTNIFKSLIKQINKNKPNYICITGDILDNTKNQQLAPLLQFLKKISKIATTLLVLGNHDIKIGEMKHWEHKENNIFIKEIKKINNLYLLEDTTYKDELNNITFYGFNLSYNYYEIQDEKYEVFEDEIHKLKSNLNKDDYNVLLIHSPINIYKYIQRNPKQNLAKTDLILSGHMHNGCLPFTFSHILNKIFKSNRGIISPIRELFPKISHGRIKDIKDGYIHEGITKFSESTKKFHILDKLYRKRIEFINIKKVSQ